MRTCSALPVAAEAEHQDKQGLRVGTAAIVSGCWMAGMRVSMLVLKLRQGDQSKRDSRLLLQRRQQ